MLPSPRPYFVTFLLGLLVVSVVAPGADRGALVQPDQPAVERAARPSEAPITLRAVVVREGRCAAEAPHAAGALRVSGAAPAPAVRL